MCGSAHIISRGEVHVCVLYDLSEFNGALRTFIFTDPLHGRAQTALVVGLLPSNCILLSSYEVSFNTYKYIYSQISFIRSHSD